MEKLTTGSEFKKEVVAVGLGPSNLALAIALVELQGEEVCNDWLFLEKSARCDWHPGMMLEGSRLQISFLKDLVTLRNPSSSFSFLNYLKEKGRLDHFINMSIFNPSRLEYADYLNWVRERLPEGMTQTGKRVVRILPVFERGTDTVSELEVIFEDTETPEIQYKAYTNKLVVAVGGKQHIPDVFAPHVGPQMIHSHEFKTKVDRLPHGEPIRFGVIGSGQSAAEIVNHLYDAFPQSEIHLLMRNGALKMVDDSPFVNEIFFPEQIEFMNRLEDDRRRALLSQYKPTNYSVVQPDLIESIYKKMYKEKVTGQQRLYIQNHTEVHAVDVTPSGYALHTRNRMTDEQQEVGLDFVILATGYERETLPNLFDDIKEYFVFQGNRPVIQNDYAVTTTSAFKPAVYVQGISELSHGISDSLLSVLPIRAAKILESICNGASEEKTQTDVHEQFAEGVSSYVNSTVTS